MYTPIAFILLLLNITIAIFTGVNDGAAGILILLIIGITLLYARIGEKSDWNARFFLCNITSTIYIVNSLIISSCFSETNFFLSSDPIRYIATVHSSHNISEVYAEIMNCYMNFADNNGLYNGMLRYIGFLCYKNGIIASSTLITLPQSLFGILTILTVYRILSEKLKCHYALKQTIIYSVCSLTLIYSGIIVRDIIIAFFYALCIEILIKPFKIKHILLLLVIMGMGMGIRLFSGFYILSFIFVYLIFNLKGKIVKLVLYPLLLISIIGFGATVFVQDMMNKTTEEIEGYTEWQSGEAAQENSGFSATLRKLPTGINYIALSLYSQMNPFPPYAPLKNPDMTGAQYYMGSLMMISGIWWFFISYTLLYLIIFEKGFRQLPPIYSALFIIAWILIAVSSAMHVDIRRLLPVYPIIFFLYLYFKSFIYSPKVIVYIQKNLLKLYLGLNLIYIIIK